MKEIKKAVIIAIIAFIVVISIISMRNYSLSSEDPRVQTALAYNDNAIDILETCDSIFVKECQENRVAIKEACNGETFEGYKKYLTYCNDSRLEPDVPPYVMDSIHTLNADAQLLRSSCAGDILSRDCIESFQDLRVMCNENPELRDRKIFTFCT